MTGHGLTLTKQNRIATITFDEVMLKHRLLTELGFTISQLGCDEDVEIIVLTGQRNVFLSGADLREFHLLENGDYARNFLKVPDVIMQDIYHSRKITIAAINGYCIGGGLEVSLACDFRVCVDQVQSMWGESVPFIGLPEVELGVVPPLGSSYFLPRIVGEATAKLVMCSGDLFTAQEAFRLGLVHQLASAETLMTEVEGLARRILKNSPEAVRQAKALINQSMQHPNVADALVAEREAFAACCDTAEKAERIGKRIKTKKSRKESLP